jgi:protein-tyrosine phosphatase
MDLIDIHCHILPGVDDGSKSMEESLAMLRIAQQCYPYYHCHTT